MVAAVGGEDVVVWPQCRTRTDRDRLLPSGEVSRPLHQSRHEEVVRGLLGAPDHRHLLVEHEQLVRIDAVRRRRVWRCHRDLPFGAGMLPLLRCDCASRRVFSSPPAVQYFRPATSSSSAGNLVMTSQPSDVTTTSSSIRAADQPSEAGQYVSRANTMPSSSTSGWSSDTRRLKIGFSQMARPTPWPYWRANAASSLANPNSSAVGHSDTMSAVVAPGRTAAIARSMYSRQRTYASRIAGDALPTAKQR